MRLATLIKDAREKRGMTQAQLSAELGLSSGQFVSNVERGVSNFPIKHASRMSKLLRISVNSIIEAKAHDQRDLLRAKAKNATVPA